METPYAIVVESRPIKSESPWKVFCLFQTANLALAWVENARTHPDLQYLEFKCSAYVIYQNQDVTI